MSASLGDHILSSYDRELGRLETLLAEMAARSEWQVQQAIDALERRDSDLARQVIADDVSLDALEREVEGLVVRLLALRAPVAVDLRTILGALKMAAIYERIGDNAKHVAKRALTVNDLQPVPQAERVAELGRAALRALQQVDRAAADSDVTLAEDVWARDETVDASYLDLVAELGAQAMKMSSCVPVCTELHFVAKAFERIGDHATNLAEMVRFQATGALTSTDRPKKG